MLVHHPPQFSILLFHAEIPAQQGQQARQDRKDQLDQLVQLDQRGQLDLLAAV